MIDNIIAVDFDGTLCKNRYPDIGEPIQEVIDKLLEEQKNGAKLILWTCRCDQELTDAVEWCERHGIIFDAVNDHLPEMKETFGNNTRKIFAHQYWDDRAVNILEELGIFTMKLPVDQMFVKSFIFVQSFIIKEFVKKVVFEIVNKPSEFAAEQGTADFLSGSAHRQNEIIDIIEEMAVNCDE